MGRTKMLCVATIAGAGFAGCGFGSPSNTEESTPANSPASQATTAEATGASGVQMAQNPFSGDTSWIAFHGYDDPGFIWIGLVHPDGSGEHRLRTGRPGDNVEPDWSPDGTRLAFNTTRGGSPEVLYEYDVTTGTTRQLVACERPCLTDWDPAYSPDGERIAFERGLRPLVNGVPSDCGIWIADLRTGRQRQLTSQTEPPCDPHEIGLVWSPDGKRLAFWREVPSASGELRTAIYTVAVDGTGEQRLTKPDMVAGEPAYSPDGKWMVFSTYPLHDELEGDSQLYRMRPDGSGMEMLTVFKGVRATQPSYSPDGEWIIFAAAYAARIDLWAIPADGGTPVVVDDRDIARTHGTWQPAP